MRAGAAVHARQAAAAGRTALRPGLQAAGGAPQHELMLLRLRMSGQVMVRPAWAGLLCKPQDSGGYGDGREQGPRQFVSRCCMASCIRPALATLDNEISLATLPNAVMCCTLADMLRSPFAVSMADLCAQHAVSHAESVRARSSARTGCGQHHSLLCAAAGQLGRMLVRLPLTQRFCTAAHVHAQAGCPMHAAAQRRSSPLTSPCAAAGGPGCSSGTAATWRPRCPACWRA